MKLCIKQHIFTFGSKFSVYDEYGNERYYVEGEIFSFGRKLHVYDCNRCEVAYIEQRLFTFTPVYSVYIGSYHAYDIHKKISLFHSAYDIDGMDLEVDGDFFGHDYGVYKDGSQVAFISKEWFTFGDVYCIDVDSPEHEVAVLCAAIVIDCLAASKNN